MKIKTGLIVYIVIWSLLLLWFWTYLPPDGAMGYSIISFYITLPISSFIVSCVIGCNKVRTKWLLPAFFGFMAMMLAYLTFSMANSISFKKVNLPDFKLLLTYAVPSIIGIIIGCIISVIIRRIHSRQAY